jgi:hypothetical protein
MEIFLFIMKSLRRVVIVGGVGLIFCPSRKNTYHKVLIEVEITINKVNK